MVTKNSNFLLKEGRVKPFFPFPKLATSLVNIEAPVRRCRSTWTRSVPMRNVELNCNHLQSHANGDGSSHGGKLVAFLRR